MVKFRIFNIFCLLLSINKVAIGQFSGFLKVGINIGSINKEYWHYQTDTISYDKPLIRPVFGMGFQYMPSKNWIGRQTILYQTKGQGTKRPDVRSFFSTSNPDILHFMSFPFSIHRRLFSNLYLGMAIQPSLYLTGSDNYYSKVPWQGWIQGAVVSLHSTIDKNFEVGIEYDHDFTYYYCEGCDERFYTIRVYSIYHFFDNLDTSERAKKSNTSRK